MDRLKERYGIDATPAEIKALAEELKNLDPLADERIISNEQDNAQVVIALLFKGQEVFATYSLNERRITTFLPHMYFVGERKNGMRIYLDDVRNPPTEDWVVVRNADDCIELLKTGKAEEISLDHDLGDGVKSGYDVANWIEEQVFIHGFKPPKMRCHSANPVGRDRINQIIRNVEKFTDGPDIIRYEEATG